MKLERLRSKRLLSALLFLLFATTACLDEQYNTGGTRDDAEKAVTFSLTLPGQTAGGSTYALTTTDEEVVSSVEVLLFSAEGNYLQTRRISSGEITPTGSQKRFAVKIPEGTYSSLVVLANSNDIVTAAGLSLTDTKAAALAKLKLANSGKWIAGTSTTGYRPIPMWGELPGATVDQNTTGTTLAAPWSLALTRMLAKVSVTLTTPEATAKLKLQSIRVYNYYNQGLVAPAAANWGLDGATAATLPEGAAKPSVTIPYATLSYTGTEITTPNVASNGEIYLFESDNAKQSDLLTRTCLVVGGIYAGDGKTHYYRIDFALNNNGTNLYLDLLRNHHYKVNVADITGPGYPNPDEAFSARPVNIEATVAAWNDAAVNNTNFGGQYMLSLSQMSYTYDSPLATTATNSNNQLTILTDYPGGWSISPTTSILDATTGNPINWLTLAAAEQSGTTNIPKTISLLLSQNYDGAPRSANILVKAGAITMAVKVTQPNEYYPPKHNGWAGSNIYWDGSKLTFDDVDVQTHKNYQGVYFKWGSLTGISPVGDYTTSTYLYPPGSSTPNSDIEWTTIPRVPDTDIKSHPIAPKTERDRAYLYELNTEIGGLGDICKYLTEQAGGTLYGKRWRMPTSNEFEAASDYLASETFGGTTSNKEDGTFTITPGYTKTDSGNPFFPASGARNINSPLVDVGTYGYYWSASPYSGSYCYYMFFNSSLVKPPYRNYHKFSFPVRCVAE